MWKIHGVTTFVQRWFIRGVKPELHDTKKQFLVKNIDFSKGPDQVGFLYDYDGEEAMKLDGVPGQARRILSSILGIMSWSSTGGRSMIRPTGSDLLLMITPIYGDAVRAPAIIPVAGGPRRQTNLRGH
jgi:hypothetical protein